MKYMFRLMQNQSPSLPQLDRQPGKNNSRFSALTALLRKCNL